VASLLRPLLLRLRDIVAILSLCLPGGFVTETSKPRASLCLASLSLCLPGGFVTETPHRAKLSDEQAHVVMPSRWLRYRDSTRASTTCFGPSRYAFPVASLPRRDMKLPTPSRKTRRYAFPVASLPRPKGCMLTITLNESLCLPGGFVTETTAPSRTTPLLLVVMPSRWLRYRDYCTLPHHSTPPRRYAFPVASLPRPAEYHDWFGRGCVVMPSRWLRY